LLVAILILGWQVLPLTIAARISILKTNIQVAKNIIRYFSNSSCRMEEEKFYCRSIVTKNEKKSVRIWLNKIHAISKGLKNQIYTAKWA